ncbi:MAG: hypothetical protein A2Y23_02365 [Clostridiales bacterium GWB2_37_7]|nr:MAG: hypothetical protein A2Y23_02365 [Clostridiales bacterium GWB2_37_7]
MIEKSYKSILEDSTRNKFLFYYSGTSVCCKEISKDGLSRDTIIASQVNDNFLTAIDLQDNIYVACISGEKGIYLFAYENNQWKLDQVLNIQGSGNIFLLSLFAHNSSIHIIYAKQMTIANFYNIYHLYKPGGPHVYHVNSNWKKNNVCEIYADDIDSAYSSVITRDGTIHLVNEWFDGTNYLINYSWYEIGNDGWKKKPITNLFKKDIKVSILYEENTLHLLCYTYEDEISAVFYYAKREGTGKDFEFSCLDKIKTENAITPYFHIESGYIFISWLNDNKFGQYSLNKEQKSWSKKFDNPIVSTDEPQVIEFVRNRKGKALIIKRTYFNIDYKNNISLPYFREGASESNDFNDSKQMRNSEGDLIRYIPYLLDEMKSLSEVVKALSVKIEQLEGKKSTSSEARPTTIAIKSTAEQKPRQNDSVILKKSSFRDQFMSTNKLISRPEASALYVGSSGIPNPEELSKKEEIKIVENTAARLDEKVSEKQACTQQASTEQPKHEIENTTQKDVNLFKKIGDFFK